MMCLSSHNRNIHRPATAGGKQWMMCLSSHNRNIHRPACF